MSEYTLDRLRNFPGDVIPVTARNPAQFLRVHVFGQDIPYRAAVLYCGALLWENGQIAADWLAESIQLAGDDIGEISRFYEYLLHRLGEHSLHYCEPFMVYRVCGDADEAEALAKELNDSGMWHGVSIQADHRKLYCTSSALNKGSAVERLRKRYGYEQVFASGDSVFDIPMLNAADAGAAPESLKHAVTNPNIIWSADDFMSDIAVDSAVRFMT
jgi:hydroxymethylpyrimidine pyrophosphatase-like HAD family hydrolase